MEWKVNCMSSTSRMRHTALRSISRPPPAPCARSCCQHAVEREAVGLSGRALAAATMPVDELPEAVDAYEPWPAAAAAECCRCADCPDRRLASAGLGAAAEADPTHLQVAVVHLDGHRVLPLA